MRNKVKMHKMKIFYRGEDAKQTDDETSPYKSAVINFNKEHYHFNVEGIDGTFYWKTLERIMNYESLFGQARKRMRQIIWVSMFFMLLDIGLFFVAPYYVTVNFLPTSVTSSPIPFGATISLCGMQAAWISALFYQYRQESIRADYIFRGKEAYPELHNP